MVPGARVDSARNRVERLVADARTGVDTLQGRLRAIEDAKNEDYAFARGLLKLLAGTMALAAQAARMAWCGRTIPARRGKPATRHKT